MQNPAREFLRKVDKLTAKTFDRDWNCSMYSRDIPAGTEPSNSHWAYPDPRRSHSLIFAIWRIHPDTYCWRGRPFYTPDAIKRYLRESETEKVLITHEDYEFVWLWDSFDPPTDIYWGLRPGKFYYVIRKNGEEVYRTTFKSHLLSEWQFLTTGTRPPKRKRTPNLLKVPAGYRTTPGGPWDEKLLIQIINESSIYPRLRQIYFRLAPDVVQDGKTEDDFWEAFFPVVEDYEQECLRRYLDYYEIRPQRRSGYYIKVLERRRAAWLIAQRFRIECEINPQDFGVA